MSLINSQLASTLVTAGGARSTFQGPSEIAEGNFLSGVKKLLQDLLLLI